MALTSWDFSGADWESPDPRDSRYWHCLAQALKERTAACNAFRATTYTLAYLDRLPYETANLFTSFPVADFDATLRLVAAQYTDHRNLSFETWLKATYNVDDQTTPTVATNKISGNVALIKYEDEWWYVDTANSSYATYERPLWTWNSLCIDALSLSGTDLATPPLQYSFLGYIDAASRWLATRYQIINMLRIIGFPSVTVSSATNLVCSTHHGTGHYKIYSNKCDSRNVIDCGFDLATVDPYHICNGTTYDGLSDCVGTCSEVVTRDEEVPYDVTNCPGTPYSSVGFYLSSNGFSRIEQIYTGGQYDGIYCAGQTAAYGGVLKAKQWVSDRWMDFQVAGKARAKHRLFYNKYTDIAGVHTDEYGLVASIEVPYKSTRTSNETISTFDISESEPESPTLSLTHTVRRWSSPPDYDTYDYIRDYGNGWLVKDWFNPTQAQLNADPFTFWKDLIAAFGRIEGNDFNFKNW